MHQVCSPNPDNFIACPDCDLLVAKINPPAGYKSQCPRCGHILLHHCRDTVSRSLALAVAGLLLFLPAIFMPLLTFQRLGMSETGNIIQTVVKFFDQGYSFVALAVFLSTAIFPLLKLSLLAFVSLCLKIQRYPVWLGKLFRLHNHLDEWTMVEVYLLGIMVTIIKMYGSTDIHFNTGAFCFTGLVVLIMASSLSVCRESFWILIEGRGKHSFQMLHTDNRPLQEAGTAAANGLLLCRECGKLSSTCMDVHEEKEWRCRRCSAHLHFRKPASLPRTWALVISAAILMLPAYLLPIMRVDFLGIPRHSTILDGIKIFFQDGSYAIALIILTASVFIPVFKVVGLAIGLLTINLSRPRFLRQKTAMFRFIGFIGKWSMLDIFVIALLAFFINFGFLTSIETAPAATYFCLVVITTMLAALTFDPRLMWDQLNARTERSENTTHPGEQ